MSATQHPSEMTTGARIVWGRRLYTHLAERVGRDVSFEELEAAFCFDICSSASNRKDMLFSKTLRFNVSKILIDVIRRIDGISIALPGLDEWERSTQSRASVMSECNSLYNNILPMFICAQCDVEPSSCTVAWILLMLSVAMHAWRCCALDCDNGSESDDETNTMYTFKKPILVCPG